MSYCTLSDIKGEFKTLVFQTSSDDGITEAEVTGFIDQASAIIDAQISNCWTLPIEVNSDNATLLSNLKTACIWLVADRIIPIIQVKNRSNNLEQTGQNEITYYAKAKSLLNMICPAKVSGLTAPSKKTASSAVDYSENDEPFFQPNTAQW